MAWNPVTHPFVVRSHRQSSQSGCHGWTISNVGEPLATYAEARALADRPMGRGEYDRTVAQALNAATWQRNGRWHQCFMRKRGGLVSEPGPIQAETPPPADRG